MFYTRVYRVGVWFGFGRSARASCGCPLLGCSLFWFRVVARLILPSPCNTISVYQSCIQTRIFRFSYVLYAYFTLTYFARV